MRRASVDSSCSTAASRTDFSTSARDRPWSIVERAPIMPMLGLIRGEERKRYVIFNPFKPPFNETDVFRDEECRKKTLGTRFHSKIFIPSLRRGFEEIPTTPATTAESENIPLLLWEGKTMGGEQHQIVVDPMLTRYLRPHQRDGVQFLFDCLTGLKNIKLPPAFGDTETVTGCMLADDMGLGKTLQSITVLWTLLNQGFNRKPTVRKAIVITPASLVKNWAAELDNWLKGRCKSTPVVESSKEAVVSLYEGFKYNPVSKVLITSYECLRLHLDKLHGCPIDLVICDEAHRLKNDKTKTSVAISQLPTLRRLLLSGTPIQNDLEEFYSLASLCVPSVLKDATKFKKYFTNPIIAGRESTATPNEQKKAKERLEEIHKICNEFILRRTNELLASVLPPKVVFVVFCNLTEAQMQQYDEIISSTTCIKVIEGNNTGKQVLSEIQALMKLCNHPSLLIAKSTDLNTPRPKASYRGTMNRLSIDYTQSGKMLFLINLVLAMKSDKDCNDRIVIISNFTQTLDLIQGILQYYQLPCIRLDGTTTIKKRHTLVTQFNDPLSHVFAFLLSSKAGGCGINLIGANRLVLFDPDWNPANDKQALARIWRDGQKKECYIYRLFSTGTIEEKIFQRQLAKDSLSSMVVNDGDQIGINDCVESENLKELFQLNKQTLCETHDLLKCTRVECGGSQNQLQPKIGDLLTWSHHQLGQNIQDPITAAAIHSKDSHVSFIMSIRIELVEVPHNKEDEENVDKGLIHSNTEEDKGNIEKGLIHSNTEEDKGNIEKGLINSNTEEIWVPSSSSSTSSSASSSSYDSEHDEDM